LAGGADAFRDVNAVGRVVGICDAIQDLANELSGHDKNGNDIRGDYNTQSDTPGGGSGLTMAFFIPTASAGYISWQIRLTGQLIPASGLTPVEGGGPFDPGSPNFNPLAYFASQGIDVVSTLPTGPATSAEFFHEYTKVDYIQ